MKKKSATPLDATDLRRSAEIRLNKRKHANQLVINANNQQLIHELEVHQIELETQNNELARTRSEVETLLEKYTNLYDFAPVGYITLSKKGLILEANIPASALLGIKRSQLIKQPFSRFILNEDQDIFYRQHQRLNETGEPQSCDLMIRKADTGLLVWAHLASILTQNGEGANIFRMMVSDISERKRAEDEIRKLNAELEGRVEVSNFKLQEAQELLIRQEKLALLGQLAGGVGHELRRPLAVILNAVYYLRLVQPDADEKIRQYHNMIEQETHSAEKIIHDLLNFARVKSADKELVPVSELIKQALEQFPVPKLVHLKLGLAVNLPKVFIDLRQMEQVLGNLFVNACQAMPTGGELTISTHQQAGMIIISVQDTGVGITPENMKKLFEPLFTTKLNGIGLGLAISQKLAEANGGWIEAHSEPGRGSTFQISLPVKQESK